MFCERLAEQFYCLSVIDSAVRRHGTLEVSCGEISKQGIGIRLSVQQTTKGSNGLVITPFEKLDSTAGHQYGLVVWSCRQPFLNQVFGSEQVGRLCKGRTFAAALLANR